MITAHDLSYPDHLTKADFEHLFKLIKLAAAISRVSPYMTSEILAHAAKLAADVESGAYPLEESHD